MDSKSFDALTRRFDGSSRRGVLKGIAGGALAALGMVGVAQASVTTQRRPGSCRRSSDICRNDDQCCSNTCDGGRCKCGNPGSVCDRDRGCCSGQCRNGECR